MEELKQQLKLKAFTFPRLMLKHRSEMKGNEDSEMLYHRQAHEIFMYTFYKNIKFDRKSLVKIDNINGYILSPINITSFNLRNGIDEKDYYDNLLFAPIPFIFVPTVEFSEVKNFCKGANKFKGDEFSGVLMDLQFACQVGIDFLACEFLLKKEISFLYIGLSYSAKQCE